jgi:hypothetical protein
VPTTHGVSFSGTGPESIKVTSKNPGKYDFEINKESSGVADKVLIKVSGPMSGRNDCEIRSYWYSNLGY